MIDVFQSTATKGYKAETIRMISIQTFEVSRTYCTTQASAGGME
jgi:hypothetical protein